MVVKSRKKRFYLYWRSINGKIIKQVVFHRVDSPKLPVLLYLPIVDTALAHAASAFLLRLWF